MTRYGIAIFPSKEIQDAANTYRKRYDPHYTLIQPHLTIREPEEWDEPRLVRAVAHLEQTAGGMTPFPITFNRYSSFYPTANVLYLAPADPEPLRQLHLRICQGEWAEENRPYIYNPHLTIGQEMTSDECQDVLASLRKRPIELLSVIDRLHLLYQTENQAWTVYQTFVFKA